MQADTDEKKIDELLSRSIAQVLPSKEELKKRLMSGEQLRFYTGTDATGPQLHLGHSTNYLLLEQFRRLGHEIIILFGDFTALIGDPTDKDAARRQQTPAEVEEHIRAWKSQVSKIVNFEDSSNPATILKNSEWLSKLTFAHVLDLASNFTLQQMLERDMFERRLKEGKEIYLHEFMYPLMQGYDSTAMNVDVEVGGTDQTFNMLVGRTLQKRINKKEKFVISTTLLENPRTGKKLMSKSEGDYIALNDEPGDMYGKVMALPDQVVRQVFVDCTALPLGEIESIISIHPKDAKMRLAREIVAMYHESDAAEKAEENWQHAFEGGKAPEDARELAVPIGEKISDALVATSIVSSKSDLRRLEEGGAISEVGGEAVANVDAVEKRPVVLRIGKHRFVKIVE